MRRYKHIKSKINKKNKIKKITNILYLFIFLIISFLLFVYIKVGNLDKFIFVNNFNDDTEIVVIDPKKNKIIKMIIPGNTQIIASRGLGTYKINSLWKLGEKEGYKGSLVAESIKKSLLLPVYLWKDEIKTNLSLWQRIKVILLETKLANYEVIKVNLADIKVLKEKKLTDGTSGFIVNSKIPDSISIYFVETLMAESVSKIEIEDLTGNITVTEYFSKIMGVMGAKITSYSKGFDKSLDCEIIGKDKKLIKIVADIFDCNEIIDSSLLVDLKVRLGERFVNRF